MRPDKLNGVEMLDLLAGSQTNVFRMADGRVMVIRCDIYDKQSATAIGRALIDKANQPIIKLPDLPHIPKPANMN